MLINDFISYSHGSQWINFRNIGNQCFFFFFCNSMETIRMVADLVRLWVIPLRTWEGDLIFNLSYFLLEDLVVSSRGVWGWGLDFDEFRI